MHSNVTTKYTIKLMVSVIKYYAKGETKLKRGLHQDNCATLN